MSASFDGLDDLIESLRNLPTEMVEQAAAESLADAARERGLDSVDSITLNLTVDDDSVQPDQDRIRAAANAMLQADRDASSD